MEQEEEIDLVDRVDTMRRTVSAVQYLGTNFDRSVSNGDEFNITHLIQGNTDRKRSQTTAKGPVNANDINKPMFTGLLQPISEHEDESNKSESTQRM